MSSCIELISVMSTWAGIIRSIPNTSTAFSATESSRSAIIAIAPLVAIAWQNSLPNKPAPPVTTTTLSFIPVNIILRFY